MQRSLLRVKLACFILMFFAVKTAGHEQHKHYRTEST
jgi:hypothetical protein